MNLKYKIPTYKHTWSNIIYNWCLAFICFWRHYKSRDKLKHKKSYHNSAQQQVEGAKKWANSFRQHTRLKKLSQLEANNNTLWTGKKYYIAIKILMLVMIVNHKYVCNETVVWCLELVCPVCDGNYWNLFKYLTVLKEKINMKIIQKTK